MKRRNFLSAAPALSAAATASAAMTGSGFRWAELGAADASRRMAAGELTSLALTQAYLARIAAVDRAGPKLNSVIELNPDAEALAAALDAERAAGKLRGPLHGLPVLIKDNIATHDRMSNTAGSIALAGVPVPRDATLVARLREAGAVILGKTNLSEWANFRGKASVSGWSSRGGQTLNPYALDRTPSGSSSGTGAALAANLALLGVGTETDGSVTSPAAVQGLVGIKPTLGLVSRYGIVPIAFSQDTAGAMCRSVADVALLLWALAGVDPADPATRAQQGRFDRDALLKLPAGALKGRRLGVATNLVEGHGRATVALFDAALQALEAAGATLVRAQLPQLPAMSAGELEVMTNEMAPAMADYLRDFAPGGPFRTLADLVAFNQAHPETLALFGQEWFEASVASVQAGGLKAPRYLKALATGQRAARAQGIDAMLKAHRLDAIVAPTSGPAWLTDVVKGDQDTTPAATTPAAVAGYPHVTVPMGQVSGLPVGLSFFGTAWTDAKLLALAADYEQRTKLRREPLFKANAG
ncbi:amidase [Roseateles saccharophilus]|uniref:Amidase n=1 Tax=Roseateles saccharophilus TaxID=304 RepID=A0A4R3UF18_ROSSA|nr:amidase [Roseateles saccharophilus]MDG0835038.1 amidase [Roseateles saccharophilus]TCU88318.1 amidase [Roseateles saccharophilus]